MELGYRKQTTLPFTETVEKARAELAKEGFGVITEIDAQETFRKKLDVDFDNYVILGVCHPASAHKVLEVDKELGLLLPCNVIVYETSGSVFISAILPTVAMQVANNPALTPLAEEIEEKLKKAVDAV